MASEELGFLHRNKDRIIAHWREYIITYVNPRFFEYRDVVDEGLLNRLFAYIVEALEENHYYELNRAFDRMLDRGHHHLISIGDIRGVLFGFIDGAKECLDELDEDTALNRYLKKQISHFAVDLRRVYSERLAGRSVEQLMRHREEIETKWMRDLPTGAVSRHLVVVSEERRLRFVQDTFELAMAFLNGTERAAVELAGDEGETITHMDAYLRDVIDFFEPRGFAISDIERAIRYLAEISEPVLFRLFEDDIHAYRRALWVVHNAVGDLALAFSDGYNQRLMRNYYNEVSIMLHRIKNKLTAVPTSLQTVMTNTYEDMVVEGDVLSPEDGELFSELQRKRQTALKQSLTAVEKALEGIDETNVAEKLPELPADLLAAREAFDELRAFIGEKRERVGAITRKLEADAVARVDEFLQDALEGGQTTTDLCRELQDIQNELYRREPPTWEPLAIDDVIREAFEESVVDAKAKEIEYTLEQGTEGIRIFGIGRELKRPFAQVINNSIKYTPEGGSVDVATMADDGSVTVAVKDSGIGIPKGEENLVFGLCERCSNAKEFNRVGSGTGLYHDRKTVLQHNGDMWVESEGEGTGSTFFIRLPIYRGDGADAQPEAEQNPADTHVNSVSAAAN